MGVDDKDYPAEEKLEATYGGHKTDIDTEPTHFSVPVDSGEQQSTWVPDTGTSRLSAGRPMPKSRLMTAHRAPRVWPTAATLALADGASGPTDLL